MSSVSRHARTGHRRWRIALLLAGAVSAAAGWAWLARQGDPEAVWRRELAGAAQALAAGDIVGAEAALDAALAAADGAGEPTMQAVALEQMARLSMAQGTLAAARGYAIRAVAALEAEQQADAALLAASVSTLALIERWREAWADAAAAYARAAELWRRAVGPDHANVAQMLDGLGRMQLALEQPDRAARAFAEGVAIQRNHSPAPSAELGEALNSLAEALRLAGRGADAEPLYREAAEVFIAARGADHPSVAAALGNLAALYVMRQLFADAEPLFERALAMLEASDTAAAAHVTTLENYAVLMERTDRPEQAAALRERASVMRNARGGN